MRAILRSISLGACAVLFLSAPSAFAQLLKPTPPTTQSTQGPLPPGLECTAEALNISGFVDDSGGVTIYNVPSSQGSVRVRATCSDALGKTVSGQSSPVTPVPGGTAHFGAFDFGAYVPVAARLTVTPSFRLVGLGATRQLSVSATFADQTTGVVTAASTGTTYRSSNPAVATVGPSGLVTAVGPGSALLYALNDGAGGLTSVSVLPATLSSLSVVPASLSFALSPVFNAQPAQLQVTAGLTDATFTDWSAASTGITYQSSDPTVAVVSIGGSVLGLSPGSATITVSDGPSGVTAQIPVEVTTSAPEPALACAMSGYAHNVDISGVWAFVASGSAGLQIINTGDCNKGGALPFSGQEAVDVCVRDSLAAVALGAGGFALVDVTSIATPHLHSTTTSIGYVRDLWISGDVLYVASSSGLFVYDVAHPSIPVLLGSQVFGSPAQAVAADSMRRLAVVLTSASTVEVIRLTGAAPWSSVSVALPWGQANDVTLFGTSAYVANGTSGLHEIDVTRPAAPVLRTSSSLTFNALGVAVQQTPRGLFIAAADDMFANHVPLFGPGLVNTFNVDFFTFPGAVQPGANSNGIALGDGFGVVTTGPSGIQVFRSRPLVDNAGGPPTVSILTPAQGASVYAGLYVVVNAAASDDVAVKSVTLLVDGQPAGSSTTPPYRFVFTAGSAGTTHTIQLQARDPGGNVGVSLPVTVNAVTPPPQATGFTVLSGSPVKYGGIDYTVLQVTFNSSTAVGATWCDDYRTLCQTYGLAPTGCGEPYVSLYYGYAACALQYGSVGGNGDLSCPPFDDVMMEAQDAGFSDAAYDNSFGFRDCDDGACQKTMCTGSFCNSALSFIDLTKPYGYTLCAAPMSCFDGHRNQGEAGVDCGGPCAQSCCGDGIKDDQETGLDCGGPVCAPCTNKCNDGIKNSDETYVDCGGTFCGPCPTGFSVLAAQPVTYDGSAYTVVKVRLNSDVATGPTWCDDYQALCQGFGLAPTGVGPPYVNGALKGYGDFMSCASQYGSAGENGDLCCDPSQRIAQAAYQAGFSDASLGNSFGFYRCDASVCKKTMCQGAYCNYALSHIDITQPYGYTLCAAKLSCTDGRRNQGELGVDCGGPCAACTNKCGDGIRNSDEVSVDCGGTFCEPCSSFAYIDTPGGEVLPDGLVAYFSALSPSAADFIFFKVDTNGGGKGGEWCAENAAWYVSTYLNAVASPEAVNVVTSGNWNKYSRPTGGTWSAPVTSGYSNVFGFYFDGTQYSWSSERGLGGLSLGVIPGRWDLIGESYADGWSNGANWAVEIKVAATRQEACGF